MIVTIIGNDRISSATLPGKIKGCFWLCEATDEGEIPLISVEGIDDQWRLFSNRNARIVDSNDPSGKNRLKSIILSPSEIRYIEKPSGEKLIMYTEPITEDRQVFHKYSVAGRTDISIGRSDQNDICIFGNFISSRHARLSLIDGRWYLSDGDGIKRSTNGLFVNGKRFFDGPVNIGDNVYIMGFKLIIGKRFIAFNNPDGLVRISSKLKPIMVSREIPPHDDDEEFNIKERCFYRAPRFKRDVETAVFQIDSPPQSPIGEELPMVLVLGSSMAMGLMSGMMLVNAITANNTASMVMGGGMLAGTVVLPFATKIYEKNRKKKKEQLRQEKYSKYLLETEQKIERECAEQEAILNENGIQLPECERRILEGSPKLWERSPGQNDFLSVLVGRGNSLLNAELRYNTRHFSLEEDNLQQKLYALCEEPKILHNTPITYSLFENFISGIIGDSKDLHPFIKGIIIQLAALYSYDEVKFVFLYDEADAAEFDFVKWLPHVWTDDKSFRFIATNTAESKELSTYFDGIISSRIEAAETGNDDFSPYFVIFSLSKQLSIRTGFIKQILSHKENIKFSIVSVFGELNDIPKECSIVAEIRGNSGKLYDKDDISGKATEFEIDKQLGSDPRALSVALANTPLDIMANQFTLPRMFTFMEMFNAGKVEHLNALNRWKENDPTNSLEAAVGIDTNGDLFKLDLHEKFHGPHGLIAGMTGSGKSEFIITYILSLAVNYHPYEVAFVLIDYKGGGMAKSFENLPHTAGVITNLDGSAIKRSLVSIESELKRRQAIFAETSKRIGVSNIDIYKYQKLYRQGEVSEPLQHLFIISDEFAELKAQQPEFMAQLISASRIGRSLGIHLILATQKPSGVVDDQIWSNSRFRICLKVQERSDSMDMLKRPEAAELVDTGRFYLQVGYNELFEMGQSAWAGAPYYPQDKVYKEKDDSLVVVDKNGRPIKQIKTDRRPIRSGNTKKQLDVITSYLRDIAEEEGIRIRPLWLDPIPAEIFLDDLREKYAVRPTPFVLDPVIGEYDDPVHQRRGLLTLPLSAEGNAIVYGVQSSGKTTFVSSMVWSLITGHTPEEVSLYLLDFGAETLRSFRNAPHVGDVLFSYEEEKIGNLFKLLNGEFAKRKKLFADHGGDYSEYIRSTGNKMPSIVVVIHNFAAFTEMYESKEDAILFLTREGPKYGIYFVLTVVGTNGVRIRLQQNFKQFFVLQLNDESDYSTIVGKTDGLYPAKFKGRGLVKTDALYEFQTAKITGEANEFEFIDNACAELAKNWKGVCAGRVPILPDRIGFDFISENISRSGAPDIPIGVEKGSLNVHRYPFGSRYITQVLSESDDHTRFICNLAVVIGEIIRSEGYFFNTSGNAVTRCGNLRRCVSADSCRKAINELFELVRDRNNAYKDAVSEGKPSPAFGRIFVLIDSLTDLIGMLEGTDKEKFSLIMLKGQTAFNVFVVFGDRARNASLLAYENWYKAQVQQNCGIWIGRGADEQYSIKINRVTQEMREDITAEYGYSVRNGAAVKVKLMNFDEEGAYGE